MILTEHQSLRIFYLYVLILDMFFGGSRISSGPVSVAVPYLVDELHRETMVEAELQYILQLALK